MTAPVLTNFTKLIVDIEKEFAEGKAVQVKEQAFFFRAVAVAATVATGIVAVALTYIALAASRPTFGLSLMLVGPFAAACALASYECYKAACIFDIIIDRANQQPATASIFPSAVPVAFDVGQFLIGRRPEWVVKLQKELDSTLILGLFANARA
jgi:hypothetical protein